MRMGPVELRIMRGWPLNIQKTVPAKAVPKKLSITPWKTDNQEDKAKDKEGKVTKVILALENVSLGIISLSIDRSYMPSSDLSWNVLRGFALLLTWVNVFLEIFGGYAFLVQYDRTSDFSECASVYLIFYLKWTIPFFHTKKVYKHISLHSKKI